MTITIYGMPAPQGSKRHVGNGVMIESSKKVKPWREAVVWAAREAGERVAGPARIWVTFTLPRPASAPKRRTVPDRKPDLDKLLRSTLDALVTAGAIEDDARIAKHVLNMALGKTEDFAVVSNTKGELENNLAAVRKFMGGGRG